MDQYDIVVIGGGAGGLTVAAGAASLGAKVALVERSPALGGDCLHYGCVPSKALIAAAKRMHTMHQSARTYGVTLEGTCDFGAVMAQVRQAIAHIQRHDDVERFRKLGVTVYEGMGRLIARDAVEVVRASSVQRLAGRRIVIATGSRPNTPAWEGLQEVGYLTNETVFSLTQKPHSLIVIGAGAIGLELAQSFARLGTAVTVLEAGTTLLAREDADVATFVVTALRQELQIETHVHIQRITYDEATGTKTVHAVVQGEQRQWSATEILVATGRKPNTEQLQLDHVGIQQQGMHIVVDATLRTNIPTIFAVGDCIPGFSFTHAAGAEGKIVVANALFGLKRKVEATSMPWVTFTDPELFHFGMTEAQARQHHGDTIGVYTAQLDDVDRFVAEHATHGMVKLITTKAGKLIGAHATGQGAGDWMQQVVYAQKMGKRIGTLSLPIYPYPTRATAVQRATDAYWRQKLFAGTLTTWTKRWIRWRGAWFS